MVALKSGRWLLNRYHLLSTCFINYECFQFCRQDKLDERKKRHKRSPLGIGSGSETETPHISMDEQTDIKIVHNNLSKTPERGILKNGPRSSDSLQNIGNKDDSGRGSRESRKPELSPSDNEVYVLSDDSKGLSKRLTYSHSKDNFDVTKLRGSPVPPHTLFVDSNGDPISIDMLEEETPSMSSKENPHVSNTQIREQKL